MRNEINKFLIPAVGMPRTLTGYRLIVEQPAWETKRLPAHPLICWLAKYLPIDPWIEVLVPKPPVLPAGQVLINSLDHSILCSPEVYAFLQREMSG